MLCRHMINAGLGVPHEYFNPIVMRGIATRLGLGSEIEGLHWRWPSLRDRLPFGNTDRIAEHDFLTKYVPALIRRRCRNGIFAVKIHFDQYLRILNNSIGEKLFDGGLFIHMYREDLLKQAISRNFAYITGRWSIDDTVTTVPMARGDLLDVEGIDRELETLANEDRGWRLFLARNGLSPLTISYEQLCKDPAGFVTALAQHVGIDIDAAGHAYSEPVAPVRNEDPSLPSKHDVERRYLAARSRFRASLEATVGKRGLATLRERQVAK